MYKIVNDDTVPNLGNSFVRRNADQTDYHLRNSVISSSPFLCRNEHALRGNQLSVIGASVFL